MRRAVLGASPRRARMAPETRDRPKLEDLAEQDQLDDDGR
jgi:hypothetical protein